MGNANDLRIPDVSVLISAAGNDVGLICFYAGDHPSDPVEVVTGISSKDALPVLRSILADALKGLADTDWVSVDGLGAGDLPEAQTNDPF